MRETFGHTARGSCVGVLVKPFSQRKNKWQLDTLQEAAQWAEDLKGIEELEHEEFLKMLGKTLDRAREMGIDTNVVNPLEEMMKSLATNALTYKRFSA
jgi:hypothetical protein